MKKKGFRETRIYPILYMIVVTAFFVGILATFHWYTQPRVKEYQLTKGKRLKLELSGLFDYEHLQKQENEEIDRLFRKHMRPDTLAAVNRVTDREGDERLIFPISGSGLWGTIQIMVAVSTDYQTLKGLRILEQNETPGLGGRIRELWFERQFSGKPLFDSGEISSYRLVSEDTADLEPLQIRQVTGATLSSQAVINIIRKQLHEKAVEDGLIEEQTGQSTEDGS